MSQIQQYIHILLRGWWVIALTTLVALSTSLAVSYQTEPQYQTRARFLVSPTPSLAEDRDLIDGIDGLENPVIAATYAEILKSGLIFDAAVDLLALNYDDVKDYEVTAVVLPEASVIDLALTGNDPLLIAQLTNAIGQEGVNYIRSIYKIHDINFLDQASIPKNPFMPQPLRDAVLAAALGLAFGVVLIIIYGTIWLHNDEHSL